MIGFSTVTPLIGGCAMTRTRRSCPQKASCAAAKCQSNLYVRGIDFAFRDQSLALGDAGDFSLLDIASRISSRRVEKGARKRNTGNNKSNLGYQVDLLIAYQMALRTGQE